MHVYVCMCSKLKQYRPIFDANTIPYSTNRAMASRRMASRKVCPPGEAPSPELDRVLAGSLHSALPLPDPTAQTGKAGSLGEPRGVG